LALLGTSSAIAAPPDAHEDNDPGAQALETGRAALDAYTRGAWKLAHARFAEAESLVHSPVFVLYMARCKRNLGELLEARELLRAITHEELAEDAPSAWRQALTSAHGELGTLQQNIPSVWVQKGPDPQVAEVFLDGRPVPVSEPGVEIELNPGEHALETVRANGARSRTTVQLSEGRRRLPIVLSSTPARQERAAAARAGTSREPPAVSGGRVIAFTALGLGALGVTMGVVSGLIAMNRSDAVKRDECDSDGNCYPSARRRVEMASDWAAASTVSFIFGAGFVAAGAGVLLFMPDPSTSTASFVVRGAF
jgi:hypothetical protein